VSGRGPVVIDTDVFGADLVPGSQLAMVYEPIIVGRPAFLSFQTVAELRFGAFRRNWGLNRPGSTGGSDLTRRLSRGCTQEV